MLPPDKKKKKEKKRRTTTKPKPKVEIIKRPATIKAVKFKTVDIPKIKTMPQAHEVDYTAQPKKESKQPIVIHNYLYPPGGQSQELQRDYEQMTGSQLPIRQVAPIEQRSVRAPPPEPAPAPIIPEPAPEPAPAPVPFDEIPPPDRPRFVPQTKKEHKMIALQERGGPYTKEEAKLVFGLDLRTRAGKETLQGLVDGGIVRL